MNSRWLMVRVKTLSVFCCSIMLMSSCQSSLEQQPLAKRANLSELSRATNLTDQLNRDSNKQLLLKETLGSTKLAALYQNILTLEHWILNGHCKLVIVHFLTKVR